MIPVWALPAWVTVILRRRGKNMRYSSSIKLTVGLALLSIFLPSLWPQDTVTSLLARLASGPFSESILYSLEGQPPDPRTMPALKVAFDQNKTAEEKQWIAATLIRLGDRSEVYFGYLADLAKDAIEDRTPFFFKYDNSGNTVEGQFDPGFLNWCAQNQKNPREVARDQFSVSLRNVRMLAYAQDPRSIELLRQGLESLNPLVVIYSVEGLGRLHDMAALPLIEKALERVKPGDRTAIAQQLCWFRTPDAERLFERFVPDSRLRDFSKHQIEMLQLLEANRVARRTGMAH
jgi:HEAT repeat protein